jgi:CxxC motif-containing protein (DUF1111 family)
MKKLAACLILVILCAVQRTAITETLSAPAEAAVPALPHVAYLQPVPGLAADQKKLFREGEKVFNTFWLAVPNDVISQWWDLSRPGPGGGEWGLGPSFLATSCVSCHVQGGRGKALDGAGGPLFMQSLRLSIPGDGPHGGPNPDPHYGLQIQSFDTVQRKDKSARAGEGEVHVSWEKHIFRFADGSTVELRKPVIQLKHLNFGPLSEGVMMSLRNSQAIFGLGYLEAVSESDILALADLQKGQGLNGRPNYVRDDINDKMAIGRFGWKANQPSIKQQIANAFLSDIGITSPIYPEQNCPPVQKECLTEKFSSKVELRDELWESLTFWILSLDAPAPRGSDKPAVRRGEKLFEAAKCAQCHVPELKTGQFDALPSLSGRTIRPYTDMLLHDMGPDLADGRPDFQASGIDWRTPPLWGIGLSKQVNGSSSFLHDGRARNVLEAIVWHGGEAAASRNRFAKLSKREREDLIAFVQSL